MKKLCILAVSIVLAVSVFSGCDKKGESSSEEATSPVSAEETQRKTEKEVVRVSQGMLPQVIEKNVTYVQKQKDGPFHGIGLFRVERRTCSAKAPPGAWFESPDIRYRNTGPA